MLVNETAKYRLPALVLLLVAAFSSCVSAQPASKAALSGADQRFGNLGDQLSPAQQAIAREALALVGRKDLKFADRSYSWDCSGTVLAAMWLAGLDLRKEYSAGSGNGVNRLDQISVRHGISYDLPLPEVGDIIFWDNTYDSNENKLWDDVLTHCGIVVGVDADGTIAYVHHDYRRGITVAYMNLIYPEERSKDTGIGLGTREINSPMRMNSDRYLNPSKWLSSHLFRSFGRFNYLLAESETLVSTR